jgi:pimeloyl-ACP methyl ester carboxylesterase
MAQRPDSLDTLRKVDVPAVVILGDEDQIASREDGAAMVEVLPQGRLVVVPAAGHLSAVEAPGAFSTAVRELVGRL